MLAWVLAYPAGDCLFWHISSHSMRSSPGIGGLVLLAAVGLVAAARAVRRLRMPRTALSVAVVSAFIVVEGHGRFLVDFFFARNTRNAVYQAYQADYLEACRWLRAQGDEADAVVSTVLEVPQPYVIMLIAARYDPAQWFRDPKIVAHRGQWDDYFRVGRWFFLHDGRIPPAYEDFQRSQPDAATVYLLRPGQESLFPGLRDSAPRHVVRTPDGRPAIRIYGVARAAAAR
jgi:hypothetical protein